MEILLSPMWVLAAISGQAILNSLLWVLAIGLICGLLWWLVGYMGVKEPFLRWCRVAIAIVAVLFLINVILTIVGHPFITW